MNMHATVRDRALDIILVGEEMREAAMPPLPNASAWHSTPFARQIVADMKRLDALTMDLNDAYNGDSGLSTVWWNIGTIEDALRPGPRNRLHNRATVVDELADRLEVLRDDAIDAARLTVYPNSWSSHAEAYDAFSAALDEHLDSVAQAVEAAR